MAPEVDRRVLRPSTNAALKCIILGNCLPYGPFVVTEEILLAAVLNQTNGLTIVKQFVQFHRAIITERLTVAAAGHGSVPTMQFLLEHKGADMRITSKHLTAAAGNESCGKEVLSLLLKQAARGDIAEEVVQTAMGNWKSWMGGDIMELLLATLGDDFPITETVVGLAWHTSPGSKIITMPRLLAHFRPRSEATDRIIYFALQTTTDAPDTELFLSHLLRLGIRIPDFAILTLIRRFWEPQLPWIFGQGRLIRITDEVVKVAAGHEDGEEAVKFLLPRAEAVEVTADVVRSIQGEISGKGIIRLLRDRGHIAG